MNNTVKYYMLIITFLCLSKILNSQPMDNVINFNIFDSSNKIINFFEGDILFNKDYKINVYVSKKGLTSNNNYPVFPKEYKASGLIYKMSCNTKDSADGLACYSVGIKYFFQKSLRIVIRNKNDSMVLNLYNLSEKESFVFVDSVHYKKGDYNIDFNTITKTTFERKEGDPITLKNICNSCTYISNPMKGLKNSRKYKKKIN